MKRQIALGIVSAVISLSLIPSSGLARPSEPPLATSNNVEYLGNVDVGGTAAGIVFKGKHAYVTGWDGLFVLDISKPAAPAVVGRHPLPHFENEDVDLCGKTLIIVNDRATRDVGAVLFVFDISTPSAPSLVAEMPVGWTGKEGIRGGGHIATFVDGKCRYLWLDGGDKVDVIDLKDRDNPKHLGRFDSWASHSPGFKVTHDTERDSEGKLWSVGGGGAAGYELTKRPLKPKLIATTGKYAVNKDFNEANSKLNDFILHNSQRRGDTLLITEEDYVDAEGGDQTPPGGCRGQGKFQTWDLRLGHRKIKPKDTWTTELNGMAGGGSADSKAPITANCSSHWFDARKGVAAVGWYEQGVRFLDYSKRWRIRQVGYYIPINGSTWAAYWAPTDKTHSIVYTADAYRGVDVIRIRNGGRRATTVQAPILDHWFGPAAPGVVAGFTRSDAWGWACPIPVRSNRADAAPIPARGLRTARVVGKR
jgi:hypothetical protein